MFDFKYLEKSKTLFIESKNLERLKLAICGLTTLNSSKLPNIGQFYCDDEYIILFISVATTITQLSDLLVNFAEGDKIN